MSDIFASPNPEIGFNSATSFFGDRFIGDDRGNTITLNNSFLRGGPVSQFTPFGSQNPSLFLPGTGITTQQQAAVQSSQSSVPGNPIPAANRSLPRVNVTPVSPPTPTSFVGQIPFFLNAVLSTPAGALPKGPLWVVIFDGFPQIIKQVKDYEPNMPTPWEIEKAFNTITSSRYQTEKGCILAQSISLPGESLITIVEGNQYNGFIRGRLGAGRQDFDLLRINFLNTNLLFVDNVIRPWTIMTGHLGMIARPKEQNYRTNLTVYRLGVVDRDTPPFILQQYNFWGVCPVSVSTEDLVYDNSSQVVKGADFTYQWYTVTSDKNVFAQGTPSQDLRGTLDGQTVARAVNPGAPIAVERAIPL